MKGRAGSNGVLRKAARSPLTYVVLGLIVIFCLFLAGGGLLLFALNRAQPTLPNVIIEEPQRGASLVVGTPSVVYARATDPDELAKAELWVNGQLVAAQANPASGNPFEITQTWRPTAAGAYLLLVRATDNRGYVGQSESLLLNVADKTAAAAGSISEVLAGDPAGPSPLIPAPTAAAPPAAGSSGGTGAPAVGIPEPPALPPGSGPADAVEPPPFSVSGLLCRLSPAVCAPSGARPAMDPEMCMLIYGTTHCPGESRPGELPPAAPRISASYGGACQVDVFWTDESTDETGFKLYRLAAGTADELIAVTRTAGAFGDHPHAGATFRYYASAYNASGESPSAPSAEVVVPFADCAVETFRPVTDLELEALSFSVTESVERVYCYYSLAGAPYVRVPGDEAQFLELVGDHWNISDYAGGSSRLHISLPIGQPLEVAGACLGWRGTELLDLGDFRNTHPADQWDGRELSGSAERFTVTYKIHLPITETREGAPQAIVDPSIPPPYNLRLGPLSSCSGGGMDPVLCGIGEELGILWDWQPAADDPRALIGYDVYYRLENHPLGAPAAGSFGRIGDVVVRQHYTSSYGLRQAQQAFSEPCVINTGTPGEPLNLGPRYGEGGFTFGTDLASELAGVVVARDVYYSVQTILADGLGGQVESPFSEELHVSLSGCPNLLVVRLDTLDFYDRADPFSRSGGAYEYETYAACEGTHDPAEAYGWFNVDASGRGGYRFYWNCPYCDDPGRAAMPDYGTAPPHDTEIYCGPAPIDLGGAALSIANPGRATSSGFSHGNNVVLLPLSDADDGLDVAFAIYDYDNILEDNLMCAVNYYVSPHGGTWSSAVGGDTYYLPSHRGEYHTDFNLDCSLLMTVYSLENVP